MTQRAVLNKRNALLACTILLLAGGGWFFATHHQAQTEPKPVAASTPELTRVEVVPVVKKTLFREERLPAEIEAYQDVLVYPKVPGFIKTITVDRGSVVKENQLMATMYAPEYIARRNDALAKVAARKAAVAAEESALAEVKADLRKREANLLADQSVYQRLHAASLVPGVVAVNDVVQWAEQVEQDKQEVNSLIKRVNAKGHEVDMRKEELLAEMKRYDDLAAFASYLEIRAPFNGYITERLMHEGSFVGADGSGAYPAIVKIKQLDLLRIVVPVPEQDAAGVVMGSQVPFEVSAFPDRKFMGTVARISDDLYRATRTMPVELNFFNPKYTVLPGMYCQVHWPIHRREQSMFVPLTAVVTTPLDSFVCKIDNDTVEWVSVTKGMIMDDMVEVFGKIAVGDNVAKVASEELQNKSHVLVVYPKAKTISQSSPQGSNSSL